MHKSYKRGYSYTYICMYVYMHIYIYILKNVQSPSVRTRQSNIYIYIYIYIYVYIHSTNTYIYRSHLSSRRLHWTIYIHIYIYIYIHVNTNLSCLRRLACISWPTARLFMASCCDSRSSRRRCISSKRTLSDVCGCVCVSSVSLQNFQRTRALKQHTWCIGGPNVPPT